MTRHTPMFAIALLCAAPVSSFASLEGVLTRMDQNAATFKAMKAKVRRVKHTVVINEEDVSSGTVAMKRSKREVQILVEITSPDPKSVALSGAKVEHYLPKLQTVEEYDLGKNKDMRGMVEKFLALGFGASGKDLKADYILRDMGVETVNGEKATRLDLTPKSKEVLQRFPKLELWISESTGYPAQQKIHEPGGDYMMIVYSDVSINPALPDSAYKLNLPKGVKRVFPAKP